MTTTALTIEEIYSLAKKLGIRTYHLQDNEEMTTIFPGIVQ